MEEGKGEGGGNLGGDVLIGSLTISEIEDNSDDWDEESMRRMEEEAEGIPFWEEIEGRKGNCDEPGSEWERMSPSVRPMEGSKKDARGRTVWKMKVLVPIGYE